MAKLPAPGRVKTRLMPALTAEQAAGVHRVFLAHMAQRLAVFGRLVVCYDPPDAGTAMRTIVGPAHRMIPQCAGDLGSRLAGAYQALAPSDALFFGVDSPDLPTAHIDRAASLLQHKDVVLGPCDDGGYWCLGAKRGLDATSMLSGIEWSSGSELQQTLTRARSLGYNAELAPHWDDVDRVEDLRRLVSRLRKSDNAGDMTLLHQLSLVLPHGVMS